MSTLGGKLCNKQGKPDWCVFSIQMSSHIALRPSFILMSLPPNLDMSHNFSKSCPALACEADPYVVCDLSVSHIPFTGCALPFLSICLNLRIKHIRRFSNITSFHDYSW